MDIKNTAITATMVIQSLVKLLENEDVDISSVKFKVGSESDGYESPEFELEKLIDLAYEGLEKIKQQATPEGFVLVPKECPDPIFADKLFDHLCKKAHGEFGDDQMIFFSDIDESAIWQLMIEAQEQSHDSQNT